MLIVLSLASLTAQAPQGEKSDLLDTTRAAIEKWVETRRLISQEKRDWALGREMLTSRIALVEREIESLRSRTAQAGKSITGLDEQKAQIVAEKEKLTSASAALRDSIAHLELRTGELLPRLPDPVRQHVARLSQRLPVAASTDHAISTTLGERFQNVVGLLNELDKFHREITVAPDVRMLADGSTAEVTTLYIGLGHGYYVNANGDAAGIGTATESGWAWRSENSVAPAVADTIAILKKERIAGFVRLPVDIR